MNLQRMLSRHETIHGLARNVYSPIKALDLLVNGRRAKQRYGLVSDFDGDPKDAWQGELGKDYTKNNNMSLGDMEAKYIEALGVTRLQINHRSIGNLPKNIAILEVGCNIGNQLLCLDKMGFKNLGGIELQQYAVDIARSREICVIEQGSADAIPCNDNDFDMVFTSGVLIHIPEDKLGKVMDEMYRVSRRYIWGFENYTKERNPLAFRALTNMFWYDDFKSKYLKRFPDLRVVNSKYYPLVNGSGHTFEVYLLEKAPGVKE